MTKTFFKHFRGKFGAGLILLLPLFITIWVLYFLFKLIDNWITPILMNILYLFEFPFVDTVPARILVPIVGLLLLILLIYLLGILMSNFIGKKVFTLFESRILKIPFIKGIYGSSKQLLSALSSTRRGAFKNVVLFEYPRKGIFSMGLVTTKRGFKLGQSEEGDVVPIFLPTTPNPTSGLFILVPRKDVTYLDITVEEGIKMIVSGGIVTPDNFMERVEKQAD